MAVNDENDISYGLQLTNRAKELIEAYCVAQTGGTIWDLENMHFPVKPQIRQCWT